MCVFSCAIFYYLFFINFIVGFDVILMHNIYTLYLLSCAMLSLVLNVNLFQFYYHNCVCELNYAYNSKSIFPS